MRQQYERMNQSIFSNNFFSCFVDGSSPHKKSLTVSQLPIRIAVAMGRNCRNKVFSANLNNHKPRGTLGHVHHFLLYIVYNKSSKIQVINPYRDYAMLPMLPSLSILDLTFTIASMPVYSSHSLSLLCNPIHMVRPSPDNFGLLS